MSTHRWTVLGLCAAACLSPPRRPDAATLPLSPVVLQAAPAAEKVLRVDGSAPEGGDGTDARPFKRLSDALSSASGQAVRVHLATGLYEGPFALADGTELVGEGEAVLHADGPAVVAVKGSARLQRLTIQGGAVGIVTAGALMLEDVALSGQRETAVRVEAGSLRSRGLRLSASISRVVGLDLARDTVATLDRATFLGPYRRAIQGKYPRQVEVVDSRFEGPVTGLYQLAGLASVRRTTFKGGRGPAIFVADTALQLRDVEVRGHEYALQGGQGSTLDVVNLSAVRPLLAGLALVRCRGKLTDVRIDDAGSHGGLQLLDSELSFARLRVSGGRESGLLVRHGKVSVSNAQLRGIRVDEGSGGDGIHVREAELKLEDVTIQDADGTCIFASADARLELRGVKLLECRLGGLVVDRSSQVQGRQLLVRGAGRASVAVTDQAKVELDGLQLVRPAPPAVLCSPDAELVLRRVASETPLGSEACLKLR